MNTTPTPPASGLQRLATRLTWTFLALAATALAATVVAALTGHPDAALALGVLDVAFAAAAVAVRP